MNAYMVHARDFKPGYVVVGSTVIDAAATAKAELEKKEHLLAEIVSVTYLGEVLNVDAPVEGVESCELPRPHIVGESHDHVPGWSEARG